SPTINSLEGLMATSTTVLSRKLRSMTGMHRLTAKELGQAVGVSDVSAKSWLRGAFAPTGINLENLALAFGVSMDTFASRMSEGAAIRAAAEAFEVAPIRAFAESG